MREPIIFFVSGIPKPAGSKRGFYIEKLKRIIITDANKNSKDWKTDVKHAAQAKYNGELWDCPIRIVLTFQMLRPQSHLRTGANAGITKDGAPRWPIVKPDVLKLARGIEDALSGIIYRDDSLIVDEHLKKIYATTPGVWIEIHEMSTTT